MKRFDRKAVIGFTLTAGIMGLLYFLAYRPLLTWSPIVPPVVVEMLDTLWFPANYVQVAEKYVPRIKEISSQSKEKISIFGGADSSGNLDKNRALSEMRANNLKELLVFFGVPSDSINVFSVVSFRPLVSNSTAEGRQLNRYTIIKWRKYE